MCTILQLLGESLAQVMLYSQVFPFSWIHSAPIGYCYFCGVQFIEGLIKLYLLRVQILCIESQVGCSNVEVLYYPH